MVRAYSIDLRERVLSAVESGTPIRLVAERFGVSPSFVSKLHTRYRTTRSSAPDRQGGDRRSGRIEAHADWLLAQVEEYPGHDACGAGAARVSAGAGSGPCRRRCGVSFTAAG